MGVHVSEGIMGEGGGEEVVERRGGVSVRGVGVGAWGRRCRVRVRGRGREGW